MTTKQNEAPRGSNATANNPGAQLKKPGSTRSKVTSIASQESEISSNRRVKDHSSLEKDVEMVLNGMLQQCMGSLQLRTNSDTEAVLAKINENVSQVYNTVRKAVTNVLDRVSGDDMHLKLSEFPMPVVTDEPINYSASCTSIPSPPHTPRPPSGIETAQKDPDSVESKTAERCTSRHSGDHELDRNTDSAEKTDDSLSTLKCIDENLSPVTVNNTSEHVPAAVSKVYAIKVHACYLAIII